MSAALNEETRAGERWYSFSEKMAAKPVARRPVVWLLIIL